MTDHTVCGGANALNILARSTDCRFGHSGNFPQCRFPQPHNNCSNFRNATTDCICWKQTGHRANYSGPQQVKRSAPISMFGQQQRQWENQANARLHIPHPGAGKYGIGCMRPCGENGQPLSNEQAKYFRIQQNGINFPLEQMEPFDIWILKRTNL